MNNLRRARTDTIESLEDRTLFSTITVAPVVVTAGNTPQQATFTALLDVPSAAPITLSYATANGTARAGVDYRRTASRIVIAPGETTASFTVKVLPNTVFEPNKFFVVNLKATGGNPITAQSGATIIENNVPPTVTVSDAIESIGLHRITKTNFWVGLSGRSAMPSTVDFTTQDVTAVSNVNYVPVTSSIVIPAYKNGANIPLKLIGATRVSPDTVFDVDFTGGAGAIVPAGLFSRIVIRDHGISPIVRPNLTISSPLAVGGNDVNFVLTLSAPSTNDVSFRFSALATSAQQSQFSPEAGIFTIPAGQTSATIAVPTFRNTVSGVNVDTQLRLVISGLANAQLATNDPIGTILAFPTITISDANVDENNASPIIPATFFVTLNAPSTLPVSVTFNTANGTGDPTITTLTDPAAASAGIDYTATSGTLTFQPGQTTLSITVPTLADPSAALTELYTVNLSGAVHGLIGRQTGTATISNLPFVIGEPQISIDDPTFAVANNATGFLNFTISLGSAANVPVTVAYSTADGTGAAGTDYTATSGTVTFNPGQTSINVPVAVFGASPVEVFATVLMNLSSPVNGAIAKGLGTGTGTITEGAVTEISINNPTVTVGFGSTALLEFNVSLNAATTVPVTVSYATANGTGVAGTDYTATSGLITFLPGQTSLQIPVTAIGASLVTKTVLLNLSLPVNAALQTATGTGSIHQSNIPQISINSPAMGVANAHTATLDFDVTLAQAALVPVTVSFATSNGTGVAGTDYTATSGSVTFTPGQTDIQVPVTIMGASATAATKTVVMTLSAAVNGQIAAAVGTGFIQEQAIPQISINNPAVGVANAHTATLNFHVTLAQAALVPVTVSFATSDGTGVAGTDYTATSGSVTFTPGQTDIAVPVTVSGASAVDVTKTVVMTLSGPVNGAIAAGIGTGSINEAGIPQISINSPAVTVAHGNTATLNFHVTLAEAALVPVTVSFTTSDGTGTAGTDYTATSGSITFTPGQTDIAVPVTVSGASAVTVTKTVVMTLSAPVNGAIAAGMGVGTGSINETP